MPENKTIFKILHISDLHLGKSLRSRDLSEDQAHILAQIVEQAASLEPDLVIVAGDVFDRSIPSESAQTLFGRFMAGLRRALPEQARILVIPGNHDSPRRVAFAAELFEAVGIHLVSDIRAEPALVLEKEERRAAVWALPFVTHGAYYEFLRGIGPARAENGDGGAALVADSAPNDGSMAGRMERVIAEMRPHFGDYDMNILAAHCYVRGATLTESEDSAFVGGTDAVPASVFDGFDYVALGHLHRRQSISSSIWYSGAPMAMSFGDGCGERGCLYAELDPGHVVDIQPITLVSLRQFKRLRGGFEELMKAASDIDTDYIEAVLTDDNPVYGAFKALSATKYPNLMSVRQEVYERAAEATALGKGAEGRARGLSRESSRRAAAIEDFVSFSDCILGESPSEDLLRDFETLLEEVEGGQV